MKIPHFLSSYRKQSKELLETHDEERAMSLAVGGDFEAVGALEFCLLKQLGLQPQHTVIDAGCGSGRLAVQLKDYLTGHFVGIDVVPELFEYARRLCQRPDWRFYAAPGTSIPEPDASADFVTFFSVFTHLQHEETYRYLQAAKRAIKPSGKIVFSFLEFHLPSHWFIFENSVKDERPDKVLNQFMDRDMIREFAQHLDLDVVEILDGHLSNIALDRTVRWDSGQEMNGCGFLGQSICVLGPRNVAAPDPLKEHHEITAIAESMQITTLREEVRTKEIQLITDPRSVDLPGCLVVYNEDELLTRRTTCSFWDDSMNTGVKQPKFSEKITVNKFILELNSEWTLDGHRFFIHDTAGFLTDKVVSDAEKTSLFSTDNDTSLSLNPSKSAGYIIERKNKKIIEISGRVGVATSIEPSNWGSFLTRIMPKVIALRQLNCSRLLVYCNNPRQLELVKLAGWEDEQIIKLNPVNTYRMESSVFPSEWTKDLYLSAASITLLHKLIVAPLNQDNASRKRIYISRKGGVAVRSGRVCINVDEVEASMKSLGLEIIIPDQLSAKNQIDLFSTADLVVGPSGAGMFNTVFCKPGTRIIDIESQTHWLYGHNNLFSSIGLDYGMYLAKPDTDAAGSHKPYLIDAESLKQRVMSFL